MVAQPARVSPMWCPHCTALAANIRLGTSCKRMWQVFAKASCLRTPAATTTTFQVPPIFAHLLKLYHSSYAFLSDPRNSKYYCVITQYVAPINTAKMIDNVRALTDNSISKKKYNFRLTCAEVSGAYSRMFTTCPRASNTYGATY